MAYIKNRFHFEIYKDPNDYEMRTLMPSCRFIGDMRNKSMYVFQAETGSHNRLWNIISSNIGQPHAREGTPDRALLLMGERKEDGRLTITTRFQKDKRAVFKAILNEDWTWADKWFPISAYIEAHRGTFKAYTMGDHPKDPNPRDRRGTR